LESSGQASARRSESLVESQPKALDLSPSQVAELRDLGRRLASTKAYWAASLRGGEDERKSTVIRCVAAEGGLHNVTVVDAVGLIGVSGLQLEVQPKIPRSHLLYLLSFSEILPRRDQARVAAGTEDSLWSLLAQWYIEALEAVLRRGLLSDYRRERNFLPASRGQVMPLATADAYYSGRIGIASEYDEFDEDSALNRVLLAAARVIAEHTLLSPQIRRRALANVFRMRHVGELHPQDLRVSVDRRSTYYRDALIFAHHVLEATGRTIAVGAEPARAFLIRTPELVESGVRTILAIGLRDLVAVRKKGRQIERSKLTLNPDLIFGNVAVGDVKYKMGERAWNREDLYQAVTFAVGFHVGHAAVISFGAGTDSLPPALGVGDVELRAFRWDINQIGAPSAAATHLINQVHSWLSRLK
jgi:5-methylcytosine-specific restriction enzyme subunit McrC